MFGWQIYCATRFNKFPRCQMKRGSLVATSIHQRLLILGPAVRAETKNIWITWLNLALLSAFENQKANSRQHFVIAAVRSSIRLITCSWQNALPINWNHAMLVCKKIFLERIQNWATIFQSLRISIFSYCPKINESFTTETKLDKTAKWQGLRC